MQKVKYLNMNEYFYPRSSVAGLAPYAIRLDIIARPGQYSPWFACTPHCPSTNRENRRLIGVDGQAIDILIYSGYCNKTALK